MAVCISWYMKALPKPGMPLRDMTLLSVLGALTFAMKLVMALIPNVEPVSLMVMLMMVVFGWKGLCGVYVYVALEILCFPAGTWVVNYLYVWAVLAILAILLRRMEHPLGWAILSAVFGLLFGALCAVTDVFIGGFGFAAAKWVSGIPFDITHCIGNFVITLLLFKPLRKLMEQLYRR